MAREFDDSNSEYLEYSGVVVPATPWAMSAWFRIDDAAAGTGHCILGVSGIADDKEYFRVAAFATPASGMFFDARGGNPAQGRASTSNGWTVNTWHHVCAVAARPQDRTVTLDGDAANKGTNTDNRSPSATQSNVGAMEMNSGFYLYASGRIAELAIWDLSGYPGADDDARGQWFEDYVLPALADGYSPGHFRLGLQHYWPFGGFHGRHDNDIMGTAADWSTPGNAPDWGDHCSVIAPTGPIVPRVTSAAPPSSKPFYYNWRRRVA